MKARNLMQTQLKKLDAIIAAILVQRDPNPELLKVLNQSQGFSATPG